MNINNEPKWIDVDVEGEVTGQKYFGRFSVKPYLTHSQKSDAVRLGEVYNRGIVTDGATRGFMITLAFLKFHIIKTDAAWWTEDGLDLIDENPIFELAAKIRELQNPKKDPPNEEPKA